MDLRYQQDALDHFIDGRRSADLPPAEPADDAELAELYALVTEMRREPEIEWPGDEFPVVAVARLSRALQGPAAISSAGFSDTAEFPAVASNGHIARPPTLPNIPEDPDELAPRRNPAAWMSQWGQMAAAAVILVLFATVLAVVLNDRAGDDEPSSPGTTLSTATAEAYVATTEPPAIILRGGAGEQAGGNGDYCWESCEDLPGVALPGQPLGVRSGESMQFDFTNPGVPSDARFGLFAYDQAVEVIDGQPWVTTPSDFSTISSLQQLPSGGPSGRFIDLPIAVDPGHYVLVVTASYDDAGQRRLVQGFNLSVVDHDGAGSTPTTATEPLDVALWRSLQEAAGFDLYAPSWLPEDFAIETPQPPMSLPGFTSAQMVYTHNGVEVLRIIEASPFQAGPDTMPEEQWSGSVVQQIGEREVRVYETDNQMIAWWQEGDTAITVEATHDAPAGSPLLEPRVDLLRMVESMVPVGHGESEPPVVPTDAALTTDAQAVERARQVIPGLDGNLDATLTESRLTTIEEMTALGLPASEQVELNAPVWIVEFSDALLPEACPEAGESVCSNGQVVIVLDALDGQLLGWHGADGQWQAADTGEATLAPPDSEAPAAGTCAALQGESVTITIHSDIPSPRCSFIGADQWLQVVNDTDQTIDVEIAQFTATIQPGAAHTFETPFGDYLAPGVHVVRTSMYPNGSGAELWLQE